ncbi:MAG: flagellar hook-basal body protein [Opitutaceae bacterium]|nr:flagellar hook-basal body protein [Opitutaceae bacterium]
MNIGLYQSASSLSALERWQDAVAQNITSSQVTGYRKRTVEFSARQAGERLLDPHDRIGRETGPSAIFPLATVGVNFITGETQPTRRELDVAIQGDGFFEVQMPDGTRAYTRNGEFHRRQDRTLVTTADNEVLNEDGSPIVLLPGAGNVTINRDGTVFQGDTMLGRIAVQKFANPGALIPVAGGMFRPTAGAGIQRVEEPELMQGYLENSNVTPLREMVDLVVISRAYEANQKMITTIDQSMQKTLEALG